MAAAEIRFIEGKDVRIWRPEGAVQPHVQVGDEFCIPNSRLKRAFPISHPTQYISLQSAKGKEIAVLNDVGQLDPDSQLIALEELDRRYFSPQILRIVSLKLDAGMWLFGVETQRGPVTFYVRNWRDSAYEIGKGRWQINSVDGIRYEISQLDTLDEASQNYLDQVF